VCEDYLEKRIISIVYAGGEKGSLSLCSRGLSPLIRRGLAMCGNQRLHKRRRIAKLILIRGIP
jgi:hypothetical protein